MPVRIKYLKKENGMQRGSLSIRSWRTQCGWGYSLAVMTQIIKEYLACSWQLTADSFYPHTGFPHHVYSSFVRFRITISVFCHCGAFPLIVIQSVGKNTLRERWKPAMCHKAKNLLLWMTFYRLPYHGYKSSHSFRMTFNGQRSYPLFSKLVADSSQLMAFIFIILIFHW